MRIIRIAIVCSLSLSPLAACSQATPPSGTTLAPALRGASSYTPYDAVAMLWSRADEYRNMVWVSSGAEAGQLLTSAAETPNRPDWILATQGVVAGLASRNEDVTVIATVYTSDEAILPVVRSGVTLGPGLRSLFIPRSSIEFAFRRFLDREGIPRDSVNVPGVERPGFATISNLLQRPGTDRDAIDFAILVDPFITNLLAEHPGAFELREGGLYEMHYSVIVRTDDLAERRSEFRRLLEQLIAADQELDTFETDESFSMEVWGRLTNGVPDRLPKLRTYSREPARLQLQPARLEQLLDDEIAFLTDSYPDELRRPSSVSAFVDASLLSEVAPDRVVR